MLLLAVAKVETLVLGGIALGFCNLSDGIFSLHLKNKVGVAKNDIIIRFSSMANKLSPSIKIIV